MHTYFIKKAGKSYDVDFTSFSADVQASILHAGLGRIMNDLVAGAKTQADSRAAVDKKLEAWARGEVRTSSERTSDPVAKRALELAANAVAKSKGFIAWLQANGFKQSTKEAIAKKNELAKGLCAVEGNKYTAQAEIDVAAAQALGDDELDIEI
jgi:hypothetical protein